MPDALGVRKSTWSLMDLIFLDIYELNTTLCCFSATHSIKEGKMSSNQFIIPNFGVIAFARKANSGFDAELSNAGYTIDERSCSKRVFNVII